MAVLPRSVYRAVEGALHRRATAIETATQMVQLAMDRATAISTGLGGGDRVQSSSTGDRLERNVISLAEARDRLTNAERWEAVFAELDKYFAGRDEARMAIYLYGEHMTQTAVARLMYVDRQTVRRWRDAYVCHAALLAAEAGLVKMYHT